MTVRCDVHLGGLSALGLHRIYVPETLVPAAGT